jgi:hypothetical protein
MVLTHDWYRGVRVLLRVYISTMTVTTMRHVRTFCSWHLLLASLTLMNLYGGNRSWYNGRMEKVSCLITI